MTDLEMLQLTLIKLSKETYELSNTINYLLNSTWPQYYDTECKMKSIIQGGLQACPNQDMREALLKFYIDDVCSSVDIHAEVLKRFIRKGLESCTIEESQKSEAV